MLPNVLADQHRHCRQYSSSMGDGEDSHQHLPEDGTDAQEGQRGEEGSTQDPGTLGKDECLLAMPPAELDESGPVPDASVEQPAAEPEPQDAEAAGSAAGTTHIWFLTQELRTVQQYFHWSFT